MAIFTSYNSANIEAATGGVKGFLRNLAKFTGKHLCQSLFIKSFIKLPVNFAKFLRTPFQRLFIAITKQIQGSFPLRNFCSKWDQIRSFLRIWSHLLKQSLMGNFIFWFCEAFSWKTFFNRSFNMKPLL